MNPELAAKPLQRVHSPGAQPPGSPALLAAACLLCLGFACSSSRDVEQPIAFPHRVHVAQEEIPCTDCHLGAEEAEHATLPGVAECSLCHEEAIGESSEEARLVQLLEEEAAIPWERVHRLREHVRFSHRRHVVAGQLICEQCHGEVAERDLPFARPFVSFNGELGMERCVACHLRSGNPRASIDCALCHR